MKSYCIPLGSTWSSSTCSYLFKKSRWPLQCLWKALPAWKLNEWQGTGFPTTCGLRQEHGFDWNPKRNSANLQQFLACHEAEETFSVLLIPLDVSNRLGRLLRPSIKALIRLSLKDEHVRKTSSTVGLASHEVWHLTKGLGDKKQRSWGVFLLALSFTLVELRPPSPPFGIRVHQQRACPESRVQIGKQSKNSPSWEEIFKLVVIK